jgi:hypothetical protein
MLPVEDRFQHLFRGYGLAYGRFNAAPPSAGGAKVKGRAETVRAPLGPAQYAAHLSGAAGLGVIMLDERDQCAFVAIDYDHRTVDHAVLARQLAELPVVVCRSKSGGAHLYVFFAAPADAAIALLWLEELRAWLGLPSGTELFPKQTQRADANDIGSWINLPYMGGDASTRYAVHPEEGALSLAAFLDYAESMRVADQSALPTLPQRGTLFADGPPCLQAYEAQGGFPEGMRNEGMKAVATYAKRRYGAQWEEELVRANPVMGNLPLAEISHLAKSYGRKDYTYACGKAPLVTHCARKVCVRRKFGVRGSGSGEEEAELMAELDGLVCVQSEPDASGLVDAESTMWYLNVNGHRVRLSTEELQNPAAFNRACLAQIRLQPLALGAKAWRTKVNELASAAEVQTIPYAATPDGITWAHVGEYLANSATCTEKRQVLMGGVYVEQGEAHFVLHRLMEFLHARRVPFGRAERLRIILLRHGARLYHEPLNGAAAVPLWAVPHVPGAPADAPAAAVGVAF